MWICRAVVVITFAKIGHIHLVDEKACCLFYMKIIFVRKFFEQRISRSLNVSAMRRSQEPNEGLRPHRHSIDTSLIRIILAMFVPTDDYWFNFLYLRMNICQNELINNHSIWWNKPFWIICVNNIESGSPSQLHGYSTTLNIQLIRVDLQ